MRVIHLPTNVGGNPQGISRHLNALNIQSETWTFEQNYFAYKADKLVVKKNDGFILKNIKKFLCLRYVFLTDFVFLNFGSAVYDPYWVYDPDKMSGFKRFSYFIYSVYSRWMSGVEVGLLKLMRVKIFIQYQGDDARQGDVFSQFKINFTNQVDSDYYNKISDEAKRKRISYFCGRASKVYALNPDLLHVLPSSAEFLPYSSISIDDWIPSYTQMMERPLRIGHAPSHRGVKGTDLIIKQIDRLRAEGYVLDFVLIEGLSNAAAKAIYQDLDVIVDQLFAGWYGGLAVEAMALGKPVISYIREEDLIFIPEDMRNDLPIIRVEPDSLYDELKKLILMPRKDLLNIAKKSRAYVERWHDPMKIAARIKRDMELALGEAR